MVTFVPGFVSQKVADRTRARNAHLAEMERRTPRDTAAVNRAMSQWDAANPAPKATLSDVADHIDHVKRVAGVDHVGIGSDFDGTDNQLPVGLEDVSTFPALLAELSRRGWSEEDLRKLAGENVLRVMTTAERVAARLRRSRPPSTRTIEELDRKRAS
jgi:membrane dipeptidase